jgi:formylglycine-generating enzyme required for sulfatase activity
MPSDTRIKPAKTIDLGGGIEMHFQWIPAGCFIMGSRGMYRDEEPQHRVQITRPFYLATFPVTQEQFACWKPEHKNGFPDRPRNPAENLDWHEANQYCQWLQNTFAHQLSTGYEVGLPTEAQWEYACRARTDTEYYTGDGESALAAAGWYSGNSNSHTQAVGLLESNELGLFDMHGNVWEWCDDAWDEDVYKKRVNVSCDPRVHGPEDADRVIRGGCWFDSVRFCRAAYRGWGRPDFRGWYQGFRVCLFLGPCAEPQQRAEQANVGMGTRDEEAKPERDRVASDFSNHFGDARFPKQ